MIKNILIQRSKMHFKKPFKIAYEEVSEAEIAVVQLEDGEGNFGLGNASPDFEITGETIQAVYDILSEKLNKYFFSFPLDDWYKYHEEIQEVFKGFPSAQAAVEEAILNLFAKSKGIKLTNLFGGYREKCKIMISLGINNKEETVREVKERLKEGYKIIKLKCGLNYKEDLERVAAVSKILPKDVKLALDANQGFSFENAKKFLQGIKDYNVALIEQPIEKENLTGLKELHLMKLVPIVADESVVTVEDAYNLLVNDYVNGVNIKLMKCGGPINFMKIFHLAKSLKKIMMIGCMYESNISMTTGVALALALPIDYADLDTGYLDFPDDPAEGGSVVKNGEIMMGKELKLKE